MGTAVLRFDVQGGDAVSQAIAKAKAQARDANGRFVAGAKQAAGEETKAATDAARGITRARLRELSLQGAARRRFTEMYKRAEAEATAAVRAETGNRGELTRREQQDVQRLALAIVSNRERAERQATAAAERAAARRRQLARDAAGAATTAVSTGVTVAAGAHGQLQDARAQRAALQTTIMGAVSQVGVTDPREIDALTTQVLQTAASRGLSAEAIAGAIAQAQTEFSTLGGMEGALNPEARAQVFQGAIDTAVQGRNLGVDPGEFSRLMGMLGQRGLDDSTRQFLAAWTVGAAQRGAVEPGSVTREAMGPILQRVSSAMARAQADLPANASTSERQAAASAAARREYMQAFAEIQVMRGLGESVRTAANNLSGLGRAMSNAGNVAKMRDNVANLADPALRARVRTALFDRQGNLNAGLDSPTAMASALMKAGMTDPVAIANLFAGTGAGNPQSLRQNFGRMLQGLAQRDAEGRTGADRVNALTDGRIALTPERQAAMRAMYEGSETANLARDEANRLLALTDNTGWLQQLSNRFAEWSARNPLTSKALPIVAGTATPMLSRIGAAALPTLARRIPYVGAALTALDAGLEYRQTRSVGRSALRAAADLADPLAAPIMRMFGPGALDAIGRAAGRGAAEVIAQHPPTATVSPSDAVHATTVRTTTPSAS